MNQQYRLTYALGTVTIRDLLHEKIWAVDDLSNCSSKEEVIGRWKELVDLANREDSLPGQLSKLSIKEGDMIVVRG